MLGPTACFGRPFSYTYRISKTILMRTILIAMLSLASSMLHAQDSTSVITLTLEECLEMALNNDINLKRSRNNLQLAKSNKTQSTLNFLPNLNAAGSYSIYQGANFDSNSGKFVTSALHSSSPYLYSQMVLFNAFANHHLLHRREHELDAAVSAVDAAEISVKAEVLVRYLNVILDRENLKNSASRLELLSSQLEREQKRQSVGVGDLETVYNFRSQVANERLNKVTLENQLRADVLLLKQSIQVSSVEPIEVTDVVIDSTALEAGYLEPFEQVLAEVLSYSYNLKQSEELMFAAGDLLKQTRSSRYPTLSLYGELGTRYSNQNTGEFYDQWKNLGYQQIALTVSVPIFTRYQTQNQIDQAKINFMNAELDYKQAYLDVTNSIQSDYLDLVAAMTSYQTAEENYEVTSQTFEFMKKRFETGNTDFYTYLESLNNKNRAEVELINAKYSIVFRKKILELYRGS